MSTKTYLIVGSGLLLAYGIYQQNQKQVDDSPIQLNSFGTTTVKQTSETNTEIPKIGCQEPPKKAGFEARLINKDTCHWKYELVDASVASPFLVERYQDPNAPFWNWYG